MALLKRTLHGIEAGIVGGLAMLGLLAAASMWHRHVWWEIPNLLGSTFSRNHALHSGLGRATLAGSALQLTLSGMVGAVFGVVSGNVRSRHRLILLGTVAGLAWFFVSNNLLWPRLNPLIPIYWPEPATVLSHVLFGLCLGYVEGYVGTIAPGPLDANGPSDAVES